MTRNRTLVFSEAPPQLNPRIHVAAGPQQAAAAAAILADPANVDVTWAVSVEVCIAPFIRCIETIVHDLKSYEVLRGNSSRPGTRRCHVCGQC